MIKFNLELKKFWAMRDYIHHFLSHLFMRIHFNLRSHWDNNGLFMKSPYGLLWADALWDLHTACTRACYAISVRYMRIRHVIRTGRTHAYVKLNSLSSRYTLSLPDQEIATRRAVKFARTGIHWSMKFVLRSFVRWSCWYSVILCELNKAQLLRMIIAPKTFK